MDSNIIIVLLLTFVINIIGTLAYSTRVIGVKTGKIAISFSIFNIFVLISRTANSLQAPFLSKKIESSIAVSSYGGIGMIFRYILLVSTIGCIVGAISMPTFQRVFYKAVKSFDIYRSIPKLIMHSFSKAGISQFKNCVKVPSKKSMKQFTNLQGMPKKVICFNIIVTALSTTAVLSSLYAGILNPAYRTTCSSLTAVVSSFATILLYLFVDPCLSVMTDDVLQGKRNESSFRRCILFMVSSRIAGTVVAQFIFLPGAIAISYIADKI